MYRLALSQTRSPHDADDVAQDVFLRLLHDATPFKDEEHLKAWLIRVTVNRCKELRRSAWKRRVDTMDETSPALANLEAPVQELVADEVWEAVRRLPDHLRLVVHLHYLEGYPVADVARLIGCNPNTVRTRLHRARKKLKLDLEKEAKHGTNAPESLPIAHEQC
ncbi:RNA polymerase sigma factor [Rubneribacter badeniensis]|uniref:RNA polymerase sigma factor n=1 Tax=Rubneribacter badeniensis TaxID=2070688 RepID=UPI001EFE1747